MQRGQLRMWATSVILGGLMGCAGCNCETIPAGYAGVKVNLLGSGRGEMELVGVGRHWISMNEDIYKFPVFEQNPKYTKGSDQDAGREIEFQTREGMAVDADFSVTYTIPTSSVVQVFQRYRLGIDEINSGPLRNILRDAVNEVTSSLPVESVYGEGKVAMLDNIEKHVAERARSVGIIVSQVSLLGAMRLPPAVVTSVNAKIEATQRAQQRENELREAEAEAKKKVAEAEGQAQAVLAVAKAQAEANLILARSLTAELVEYRRVDKWDGKLPSVTGGGATVFGGDFLGKAAVAGR